MRSDVVGALEFHCVVAIGAVVNPCLERNHLHKLLPQRHVFVAHACHGASGVVAVTAENPVRGFVNGVNLLGVDALRGVVLGGNLMLHLHAIDNRCIVVASDGLGIDLKPQVALGATRILAVAEWNRGERGILGIHSVDLLACEVVVEVELAQSREVCAVGGEVAHHLGAEILLEPGGIVEVEFLLIPLFGREPSHRAQSARCGERGVEVIFSPTKHGLGVREAAHEVHSAHGVVGGHGERVGRRGDELLCCRGLFLARNHRPHLAVVDFRYIAGGVVFCEERSIVTCLAHGARQLPRHRGHHLAEFHIVGKGVVDRASRCCQHSRCE